MGFVYGLILTLKSAVYFSYLVTQSYLLPILCLRQGPGPCFFMPSNLGSPGSTYLLTKHVYSTYDGPGTVLSIDQVVTNINSF